MTKVEDKKYVRGIPRKPLPKNRVLVHNHVLPAKSLNDRGFRAWTETLHDGLEVCPCDWAGVDLGGLIHYRVKAAYSPAIRRMSAATLAKLQQKQREKLAKADAQRMEDLI
jgi:hypothetical protein